jgi:hypothetical protein
MATLAEVARTRKEGLKRLQKASLQLDAAQEKVERETKRLLTRKKAVPEAADMTRILSLISGVSASLDNIAGIAQDLLSLYGR